MAMPDNAPAHKLSQREVRSIILGLLTAMFPAALDSTVMGPAMPTIGREIGNIEHLPWVMTGYLLMSTAATPLYGKLSDIYGRRLLLLAAISIFALGSLLCAVSPNMIALALARAVQGIGGGGLVSLCITIIGDIVPVRERPRYQIYTTAMWAASSLAGPVLGGYLAERWHWSWIFWINVPICLVAYLLTGSKLKNLPRHERPHKLDFAGAILLVVSSVALQFAFTSGGSRYPWLSVEILSLLALGFATAALLVWRLMTAEEPLIPIALLRNKVVLIGSAAAGLAAGVFIALTIYVPIYFENALGYTATGSGLALVPLMIGTTLGAMGAGKVMMMVKHYRFVPIAGLGIAVVCLTPLFLFPLGLPMWLIQILFGLGSMGIGTSFPVSMISVQNAVALHQLGTATSTVSFARNFGSAIGVAVFGAIVINGGATMASSGEGVMVSGAAFAEIFRWIFGASIIGLLMGIGVLWQMPENPLGRRGDSKAFRK